MILILSFLPACARAERSNLLDTLPDSVRIQAHRENVALGLGALGTALPFAAGIALAATKGGVGPGVTVLLAGLTIGPSWGEFYAGAPVAPWVGVGIRAAAVGLMVASAQGSHPDCGEDDECSWSASPLLLTGIGVMAGGCLISLFDGPFAVVRSDARKARIGVVPYLDPRTKRPGILATAEF